MQSKTFIVGTNSLSRWLPTFELQNSVVPIPITSEPLKKQSTALENIAKNNPEATFIGVTDLAMLLIAMTFMDKNPSLANTVAHLQHKGLFYSLLNAQGVPIKPWTVLSQTLQSCNLTFPVFLRPIRGCFSTGSQFISDKNKLLSIPMSTSTPSDIQQFFDAYSSIPLSAFLLQEYISAPQYTVDYFVLSGKVLIQAVTESIFDTKNRSFIGFETPVELSPKIYQQLQSILQKVVTTLSINSGAFNTEFFVDKSTVHIIESNSRVSAQFLPLFNFSLQTNYLENMIRLTHNQKSNLLHSKPQKAHIVVFRKYTDTVTRQLPSPAKIAALENKYGLLELHITAKAHTPLSRMKQDGHSFRYAYATLPGNFFKNRKKHRELEFELSPLLFNL